MRFETTLLPVLVVAYYLFAHIRFAHGAHGILLQLPVVMHRGLK